MSVTTTRAKAAAYFELTKPGITRMVLITSAAGYYLAGGASQPLLVFLHAMLGIGLAASGTNALNQWFERDIDAHMRRTAERPLPSGRLTVRAAFAFAWLNGIGGLVYLTAFVNLMTAAVVAFTLFSYVFIYTPLKRRTWIATLIGAVPGALPIVAGWTAAGGSLDAGAWALFGIMFIWQMPHFYALAWIYREDYRRAGFQMLTVVDGTGGRASAQTLMYAAVLIPISLLPVALGLAGNLYLAGAFLLGAAFLVVTGAMWAGGPNERTAFRVFSGSIVYLPILLLLIVIDKV